MIIDLIMVNTIFWSFFTGYRTNSKKIIFKLLVIIVSLSITLYTQTKVTLINENIIIETIAESDYTILVTDNSNQRDYALTKNFVEQLPVTTEIQNKIIDNYYKNNSGYVVEELVNVAGKTITHTMEILLIFTVIIVFLNMVGGIVTYLKEKPWGGIATGFANVLSNVVLVSAVLILIKMISLFMVKDMPEISFAGSLFLPLLHKIVDIIINVI